MSSNRGLRHIIRSASWAFALATLFGVPAQAQDGYPSRPVKVIVPFAAGGAADTFARMIGQHLQQRLGQPFVIENAGGAGGAVGLANLNRSDADGYTIALGGTGGIAIAPTLYAGKLPYDVKQMAAITQVSEVPNVLAVNPQRIAAKTVGELIAHLKANPGTVTVGSAGAGSSQHLAGELFQQLTGTKMVHVPYKGSSPMITDLIGGQIDVAFDNGPLVLQTAAAGKLRILGVATLQRAPFDPTLPTIAETVSGFQANAWHVFLAPAGTPKPIINKLSQEIQGFMRLSETVKKMADLGSVAVSNTPEQAAKRIESEIALWRAVIQKANVKAD